MNAKVGVRKATPGAWGAEIAATFTGFVQWAPQSVALTIWIDAPSEVAVGWPGGRENPPPPFVERLNTIGNAPPKPRKLVKLTYTLPAHGLAAAGFRSISIHSLSTKIPAKPKGWLGTAKPTAPRSTM